MTEELLKKYIAAHIAAQTMRNIKNNIQIQLDKQNEKKQKEITKAVKAILVRTPWLIDQVNVLTQVYPDSELEHNALIEVSVSISKSNKVADFLRTQISFASTPNDVGSMLHEIKCFVNSL